MSTDVPDRVPTPTCPLAPEQNAAVLLDRVIAARDLHDPHSTLQAWLWHGYLGPGKITLLTSQWKSGKTTLLALLLARMRQGGTLAGLSVATGKAFVISEESESNWGTRFAPLGNQDHVHLLCRPFKVQPGMTDWLALIDAAQAMHDRHGSGLVVFDSLQAFLPANHENSAGAILECLAPLQRLAEAGMSVFLLHHPRKGRTLAGQASRGSGALPGFVDILMEMHYQGDPDEQDRRRRLVAFSRYDETPRHLLLELEPDGSDYLVRQAGQEESQNETWHGVLDVLKEAYLKMTRQEILQVWPRDFKKPNSATLWRWLNRMVAQGVVRQNGTGLPGKPFRYWLPEREDVLAPEIENADALLQSLSDRWVTEAMENLARSTESDSKPKSKPHAKPKKPRTPAAIPQPKSEPSESLPPSTPEPQVVTIAVPVPELSTKAECAPTVPITEPSTASIDLKILSNPMDPTDAEKEFYRRYGKPMDKPTR